MLCLYLLWCFMFCLSLLYASVVEEWCACGSRAMRCFERGYACCCRRRHRRRYVELSDTRTLAERLRHYSRSRRRGYIADVYSGRFDESQTNPPIVPFGDTYDDGGPVFF